MAQDTVNGHVLPTDANINTLSGSDDIAKIVTAVRIFAEAINTSGAVDASVTEGALAVTSDDASALAVGPNGATAPVLKVDGSQTGSTGGVEIIGGITSSDIQIRAIGGVTNQALAINAKGAGTVKIGNISTGAVSLGTNTGAGINLNTIMAVKGTMTFDDAINIVTNTVTGTKIGTATTQKVAFFNATPIVQPASADQISVTITAGTFGVDSAASMTGLVTLALAMRSTLVNLGLMKGAA